MLSQFRTPKAGRSQRSTALPEWNYQVAISEPCQGNSSRGGRVNHRRGRRQLLLGQPLLGGPALRESARQENRPALAPSAPLPDQENHVLTTLQSARDPVELFFGVYRLFVYLKDDVATTQPNVFAK